MGATVRAGLAALAKVLLVLIGVPLALVRLWMLTPLALHPFTPRSFVSVAMLSHGALAAAGLLWVGAAAQLARELSGALTRNGTGGTAGWSARWAGQLAGLMLLATSGTAFSGIVGHHGETHARSLGVVASARAPARTSPRAESASRSGALAEELLACTLGVLVAGALVRRTRRLRRATECARRPGSRAVPPSASATTHELLLERVGHPEVLADVEDANRLLGAIASSHPRGVPRICLVRCATDSVDFLLDEPRTPAPAPFRAGADGRWWVIERGALERGAASAAPRAVTCLVPVGDDGEASYLLALGPRRGLGILGAPADVEAVLAGIVLGLRTLPWAEDLDVELVGIAAPPPSEHCYQLHPSTAATVHALAAQRLRVAPAGGSARDTLAVLAPGSDAADEGLLEHLDEAMAVITAGTPGTATLLCEDEDALLSPFGLALRPPRLAGRDAELAETLLAEAVAAPRRAPARGPGTEPAPERDERADRGLVELQLLAGRPRLCGVEGLGIDDHRRVAELVCFLLERGGSARPEELAQALFPGRSNAATARSDHLVALARAALSTTAGVELTPAIDGVHRLVGPVTGDWLRVRALLGAARRTAPGPALALLREALELVGERPLALESTGYGWFRAGSGEREAVADVIDAAHHLATLATAGGDLATAHAALEAGRRVEPYSEALVRDAMVIAEREGDGAGLERLLNELERGLLELGAEPSSDTLTVYAALRAQASGTQSSGAVPRR